MRFKINLSAIGQKRFLPMDYQYAMASAIYKVIANGDAAYSKFLHNDGFSSGGLKKFKLFAFSPLTLPHYKVWKDKGLFELQDDHVSFEISFMADKAAETFIKGMFTNQHLDIGDRFHCLRTQVTSIEAMQAPFFTSTMRYRCVSPLTIKLKEEGWKHEQYLYPDDPRFGDLLIQNLISKCVALDILHATGQEHDALRFELQSDFRSKLHTIKPYTSEETKVRGFLFDFAFTAPEYMHEMGYYAGFGMNNGMGFGATIVL
jgi:CRISPR-associated endoribonuclease Cas6